MTADSSGAGPDNFIYYLHWAFPGYDLLHIVIFTRISSTNSKRERWGVGVHSRQQHGVLLDKILLRYHKQVKDLKKTRTIRPFSSSLPAIPLLVPSKHRQNLNTTDIIS
jgi:hypothetical protein